MKNSESDSSPEQKDRTKWIWLGVIVAVVAMLLVLWQTEGVTPNRSLVRAKHILVEFDDKDPASQRRAYDLAKTLRKQLLDGSADFDGLARKYSNDPGSATKGGDLGYFERGSFATEFEEYVWDAPLNEVSDVIQTEFGFHLIVVTDRVITELDRAREAEARQISGEAGDASPSDAPASD